MRLLTSDRFASGLLAIWALLSCRSLAMADGGTVRLLEQKGDYQIAVFTEPTPLRAGLVDISVLIQQADTQSPISEVEVTIEARRRGDAGPTISHPATTEAATNKLFRAATFELPEAGWWDLEVSIDGPLGMTQARFDVEVAEPLPPYLAMWPWVCWPVLPILVFGAHQFLVRRRSS
jgi:hypothetical protein